VRDRAQRRGENGRQLPRERLVDDLKRPDVVTTEFAGSPEVEWLDVRLSAFLGHHRHAA
jgi:hypothetical protein